MLRSENKQKEITNTGKGAGKGATRRVMHSFEFTIRCYGLQECVKPRNKRSAEGLHLDRRQLQAPSSPPTACSKCHSLSYDHRTIMTVFLRLLHLSFERHDRSCDQASRHVTLARVHLMEEGWRVSHIVASTASTQQALAAQRRLAR